MHNEILDGHIYKHYKGGLYTVKGVAIHSESCTKLVVYQNAEGQLWARPLDMFLEYVTVNGQSVKRFTPVVPTQEEGG